MKYLQQKRKTEEQASGSQVLALGLFIMLLAFFIVLNTLSTFDEKVARPVLASLERTFASRIYREDIGQTQIQSTAQSNQEGTSLQRISGLFKARIPGTRFVSERKGILHVQVKAKTFTEAINKMAALNEFDKKELVAFRDIFVAVLSSQKTGMPLRLDITFMTNKDPTEPQKYSKNLKTSEIKKTAELAALLQASGLPMNLFSVAYTQGQRNMVDLKFQVYEPYDYSALIGGQ